MRGDLTKSLIAVQGDHRAHIFHHAGMAVELQVALFKGANIARDHPYAMRIVSGKVCRQQMFRNKASFLWFAARIVQDFLDKMV